MASEGLFVLRIIALNIEFRVGEEGVWGTQEIKAQDIMNSQGSHPEEAMSYIHTYDLPEG